MRKFRLNGNVSAISVGGKQYDADKNGFVEVDEKHADELAASGLVEDIAAFTPVISDTTPVKPASAAVQSKTPQTKAPFNMSGAGSKQTGQAQQPTEEQKQAIAEREAEAEQALAAVAKPKPTVTIPVSTAKATITVTPVHPATKGK